MEIEFKKENNYGKERYNMYGYDEEGYNKDGYNIRGFDKEGIHRATGTEYDFAGYDKDGYNIRGFDEIGFHKITKTIYDEEGYDKDGYDEEGYNKEGYDRRNFDKEGIHKITGTEYDLAGYNKDGYNIRGFDAKGIHKITKTIYDEEGYSTNGYDKRGYRKSGYNRYGYDRRGFNERGFHRQTGTKYNLEGFNKEGIHKITGTEYDFAGFNIDGIHRKTGREYNAEGFTRKQLHKMNIKREITGIEYNEEGYDKKGFNERGFHRVTHTRYNEYGLDECGYNKKGYKWNKATAQYVDRHGFNEKGYNIYTSSFKDKKGLTKIQYDYGVRDTTELKQKGWNIDETNIKTGTMYDEEGYDIYGYDEDGYNREGYDRNGFDEWGFKKNGIHKATKERTDRHGYTRKQYMEERKQEEIIRIKQEYEKQGENHPKLILVNNFLNSNTSRKIFCKINNIGEEELKEIFREVGSIYPELDKKIKDKGNQTSAIYLDTVERIVKKLLSGEMTLVQYSRKKGSNIKIDKLLGDTKYFEDRKNLQIIILDAITSGELQMMDYVKLFSPEYDYKTVINSVNLFLKGTEKELPELQGKGKPINLARMQLNELKKFQKPYKKVEGEKIGFFEKPEDKEPKMFEITDKERKIARDYLRMKGEYICNKTMNETLLRIAKGEISEEQILRLKKENKLLNLQEEDKKLDELIGMAKQVVEVQPTNSLDEENDEQTL